MKKRFYQILFLILLGDLALAQVPLQFGGYLGYRSAEIDTDIRGATTNARPGWQFGVLMTLPVHPIFEVRSGFSYVQRYSEIGNTADGVVSLDYSYIDVPVQASLRFSEAAAAFAGPVLSFNQSKDVTCSRNSSCAATDVKSVIVPWQLGVGFRFLPQLGAEIYYEYIPGDLSANVQNMKTVGANFIFYFE